MQCLMSHRVAMAANHRSSECEDGVPATLFDRRTNMETAAAYVKVCSGDVRGFVRQEPDNGFRNLGGIGVTLHWDSPLDLRAGGTLSYLLDHLGVRDTRAHGIYADPFDSHLSGKAGREHIDGTLARRVG